MNLAMLLVVSADPIVKVLSASYTVVVGCLLSSVLLPFHWVTPDPVAWLLMAATGFFSCSGHFAMIKAFATAAAATVAPFMYTLLIRAAVYGFLLFDHVPYMWTIAGATVIVTAALYVLRGHGPAPEGRSRAGSR